MKTSQFFAILAIIGLIGFSSCSKKSDDVAPEETATTAGFRVKVDGKTYAPDFSYALASFPANDKYYGVYGLDSKTSDVVAIALPNTAGVGTHEISTVTFGVLNLGNESYSTINGGTGTITITKKTATNVVGTFSFTAYDATGKLKKALTEGSFNVNVR
ncbi:hypothetical protein GCM10028803_02150 [Larkinella knui]|uniref:Uncharacterized protein n=1 Tax=Larkinella knui TaxID=2025310 RepID=A0A3P1CL72_9BACT|nr:DUF6252 family protein [Larkinella knui]RRB14083.1 hypothetical protein EHT87_17740 [Larkinella knui]